MELSKRAEVAYSYAQEVSKQLLTLSTAVFALTITFDDKIASSATEGRTWLKAGWGLYLASVVFGIFVLMALAGNVAEPPTEEGPDGSPAPADSIYDAGLRLLGGLQILLFLAALGCTFMYGVRVT